MKHDEQSIQPGVVSGGNYARWVCPNCETLTVVPIVIGYPNIEDFEAAEAGHVILQGCIVYGDEPKHGVACTRCDWFGERLPGNRIRQIPRPQAFENQSVFDFDEIQTDGTDSNS